MPKLAILIVGKNLLGEGDNYFFPSFFIGNSYFIGNYYIEDIKDYLLCIILDIGGEACIGKLNNFISSIGFFIIVSLLISIDPFFDCFFVPQCLT